MHIKHSMRESQDEIISKGSPDTSPVALRPVLKARRRFRPRPEVMMRKMVFSMTGALPQLASSGQWMPLRRTFKLLLWFIQHVPGAASMLLAARGTSRIQDAIRLAAACNDLTALPAAPAALQPGTTLLLYCVLFPESAGELVVETQTIRLILQLLRRRDVSISSKRNIGRIIRALAATKLVYRDVLHGAGVVEAVMGFLADAACLTDLVLVQELLWVLIHLCDDDGVYCEDMREVGLPQLLVAMLSVYQANIAVAELRPVAAQMLRCLHLMASCSTAAQAQCAQLHLIALLVQQVHLDIHQLDEPPLPPSAANMLSLSSLPTTPKSPHKPSGSFAPLSPLRRSSSGSSSPRSVSSLAAATAASTGRRGSIVETTIPEDEEADVQLPDSPVMSSYLASRSVVYAGHCSEAAPLRGLGLGPTPLQRVAAAALLREVLRNTMSKTTVEVLLHGMLLPALQMQLVAPRLSLAMEVSVALRVLLAGSPANQAEAMRQGAGSLFVVLLSARNIELASAAAEVVLLLADSEVPGALQGLASRAVTNLTELLSECAAHATAVGLERRTSNVSQLSAAGLGIGEDRGTASMAAAAAAELLQPIPEVTQDDRSAGASYSAHLSTSVLRHPSLNRDGSLPVIQLPQLHTNISAQLVPGSSSLHLAPSRERVRISVGGSMQCLVCATTTHEACGFCPMSATVKALTAIMRQQQGLLPQLQDDFSAAGGLEVVVGLITGEVGVTDRRERLMQSLAELLTVAVVGNQQAQDQVRIVGGVDVCCEALLKVTACYQPSSLQLCLTLLRLLTVLTKDNSANKLSMREGGGLEALEALLRVVLASLAAASCSSSGSAGTAAAEELGHALLDLLSACLPDSPGSQQDLHQLGVTSQLLQLLRSPSNSPSLGLSTIRGLGLLANKDVPAALAEVTAGGLVAVVMNVLQQQAMAGVLVSEVCMNALPSLLDGNPKGKQQALQYGVLPLLVHLLRSSPSPVTLVAAARTLAVLAAGDTELQGQITSAGGLHVLLDKLDPANTDAAAAPEAQAAAASAAAAAATAAAEAVAKAAAVEAQAAADAAAAEAAAASAVASTDCRLAEGSSSTTGLQRPEQQEQTIPGTAQRIFQAVSSPGNSSPLTSAGITAFSFQGNSDLVDSELAAAKQRLALLQVQVACLEAVAALAHDNSFTKNTARQQGVMLLLVDLLRVSKEPLQAAVMEAHQERQVQQHQIQQPQSSLRHNQQLHSPGAWQTDSMGLLERPVSLWQHPQHSLKAIRTHRGQQLPLTCKEQQRQQYHATQLRLLDAAVRVLAELCHGNHSNQQSAAAEGLIDQLTALAALVLGAGLAVAAVHSQLLAAIADALSATAEYCVPNKLVCRESGAVEAMSRLLLAAAEVADLEEVLVGLRLSPAIASACGAVVALTQDCEDNQRAFLANPDFLPALFRLLGAEEPHVAVQAGRALEFIAIRNDIADDADDRGDFEGDTVMALIRTLSRGALSISGSGKTATARAAVGSAATITPSASVVKEAADLLLHVVEASDPVLLAAGMAGPTAGSGTTGSGTSAAPAGLGTAPLHSSMQAAKLASTSSRRLVSQGSMKQASANSGCAAANISPPVEDGTMDALQRPAALLPAVIMDHTSGLAVLRTWSLQEDMGGVWQQLVGRSAPAFQVISRAVPDGPWKPFASQVAWMLLLLAVKSPQNRSMISKVQRTTLAPLAMQLENAERYLQQAAETTAAAGKAMPADVGANPGPADRAALQRLDHGNVQASGVADKQVPHGQQSPCTSVEALPGTSHQLEAGASFSTGGVLPASTSVTMPALEDDDMLQAEIAFLGLTGTPSVPEKGQHVNLS